MKDQLYRGTASVPNPVPFPCSHASFGSEGENRVVPVRVDREGDATESAIF